MNEDITPTYLLDKSSVSKNNDFYGSGNFTVQDLGSLEWEKKISWFFAGFMNSQS